MVEGAGSQSSWVRASAPAKVFLLGEYVALLGAPALVAALTPRVEVELRLASTDHWRVECDTPRESRTHELSGLLAMDPGENMLAAVLQRLQQHGVPLPRGASLRVVLSAVRDSKGAPLGLGSSAATCVALAAVLAPESWGRQPCLKLAAESHRSYQGGRGSGYDVAASLYGGMSLIGAWPCSDSMGNDQNWSVPVEQPLRYTLPEGLSLIVALGERTFSTSQAIDAFDRGALQSSEVARLLDEMSRLMRSFVASLETEQQLSPVETMREYCELESRLGPLLSLQIVSPPILRLASYFGSLGGACKPSGAGGGDVVVGLVPASALSDAVLALREEGFRPASVGVDESGLVVTRSAESAS